ncbi:MAG: fructose-6-phosphate aldolase [Armatimonadetes bacterium]|nr:fructose-6-phosphate aldolase [Armatimonadota bacterium]
MKIYLDTANVGDITKGVALGCVSGVTTNPSIIARENKSFAQCIADIVAIDPNLTILVEAVSEGRDELVAEARELVKSAGDVVIKLPMTSTGLAACKVLSSEAIRVTMTLVFSLNQAILASNAGASFVAPFVGRLDDINSDGLGLVQSIRNTFDIQGVDTRIIAASIRTPQSVADLFAAGCDIVTMPYSVLQSMIAHPLTEAGLKKFAEDWKKVPAGA